MSSQSAMDKHSGGVAKYRAAEGKTVLLPYRGSVDGTISDILGGVRSTCTYVGAAKLKELTKRTTFIRVQEQENTYSVKRSNIILRKIRTVKGRFLRLFFCLKFLWRRLQI